MFSELLIKGMPHDEATTEFKKFLHHKLNLKNQRVVHYQLTTNTKVILLRFRGEKAHLLNRKLFYKRKRLILTEMERPIVSAINTIESINKEIKKQLGKKRFQEFAKVNLSSIPEKITIEEIYGEMGKYGKVKDVELFEKGQFKNRKRLKCRIAFVEFDNIDGAVNAFYKDKVTFLDKSIKVKMYLTPKKVEEFVKEKI